MRTRTALQLPEDKRIVLFATQIYPWFASAAKALFVAARNHSQCIICVKTHPHDKSLDDYRKLAADVGATNVRFYADNFNELLAACDVLVSGSSTATLEAILAGRDAICVNFSSEPDRYPYVAEGGSLGATNAEEMRIALDAALDPARNDERAADRREFIERHVGPTADSRAASTFVSRVMAIVDGKLHAADASLSSSATR
jgi:CDP-glycerol glycerophosphotransferase (TagB/SpsB family)